MSRGVAVSDGRVLVVDDDQDVRSFVGLFLELEGFDAVPSGAGPDAVVHLRHETFDVVVCDLLSSSMSATNLLRFTLHHLPEVPVVLMAVPEALDDAVHAMQDGVFDYVAKPIMPGALIQAVKKALRHRHLQQETAIYRLSRVVFEIEDPDRLLDELTVLTRKALRADLAAVLTRDRHRLQPQFTAWSDRIGAHPLGLDHLVAIGEAARAADIARMDPTERIIAIPLGSVRFPGAVLALARAPESKAFYRRDMETAQLIGAQASLAIDNASLVHELRERIETLERANRRLLEALDVEAPPDTVTEPAALSG